ncbi:group 1 truncated hemoglobin [Pseudomonas sp. Q2-TVG4-2]|uniref:group I truncated hemoglobin n=1 Tax=Pseudomonas sp. Q2-TVG4-2 TaxID=1685699 RepID=UPI0015E699E4|nr:group 1 truncated hemoglobin [Pseudomonas sp. Q2-TVG4-2]
MNIYIEKFLTQLRTVFVLAFVSFASSGVQADTSTFEDFGGKPGLVRIMDDLMINLIEDPRTRDFFNNEKQDFIKAMLVEQMCELLDGGCTYTGRDMKASHAHLSINRAEFNALVESFQLAMDKHGVPFASQNKLLAKLAPMYRDIEGPAGQGPKATSSAESMSR